MDKFRKARSKIIAVAKFPTPRSELVDKNKDEEDDYAKFLEATTQTETTFPSWIHVWEDKDLIEEQQLLSSMMSFAGHNKAHNNNNNRTLVKHPPGSLADALVAKNREDVSIPTFSIQNGSITQDAFNYSSNNTINNNVAGGGGGGVDQNNSNNNNNGGPRPNHIIFNSASEREFMRRLHCQEYKVLQQLREIVRQHMTDLGTTVYDLCAYKDIALTMKEKFALGPLNDLVLMSSKMFRRTSDLSRSLATLFNIMFADEFCDRDFDFTDQRLTKLALRRTEQELESVTKQRDELKKRCSDAESKLAEYQKSHTVLKQQRDEAESRYNTISRDMALLFQKSVDDVTKLETENLKSVDINLDAHNLVAPARSIAQQSVDNAIDKLSNVVQGLKTLYDDIGQMDFGGSLRTSVRTMDGLVNSCLTKLTHVRDGIRTSADVMRHEMQQRKKAVELSVLHVLAAEKMRAKIRQGREVLNAVREKAIVCSDLIRTSRINAVERKQELEKQMLKDYLVSVGREASGSLMLQLDSKESSSVLQSPQSMSGFGNNTNNKQSPTKNTIPTTSSSAQKPPVHPSSSPPASSIHHPPNQHWNTTTTTGGTSSNQQRRGNSPPVPFTHHNAIIAANSTTSVQNSRKNSAQTSSRPTSGGQHHQNTNNNKQPRLPPVFVIAPESFDQADEFSMHMTNLIAVISNAASMLSHEDELTDIIDSLSCSLPQAGVSKSQQQGTTESLGREVLDHALDTLHSSNEGGILSSTSNSDSSSATSTAFKQFAEMAQFMREMFEERIRELEETKGFSANNDNNNNDGSASSSNNKKHSSSPSSSSIDPSALASKTDAEMLEDQAVQALEGWRKRRRGETNLGKIQIADALRELDGARKERKRKHEEEMKRMGIQKRFEFGVTTTSGNFNDDDGDDRGGSDDDIPEAPSLVVDVTQVY